MQRSQGRRSWQWRIWWSGKAFPCPVWETYRVCLRSGHWFGDLASCAGKVCVAEEDTVKVVSPGISIEWLVCTSTGWCWGGDQREGRCLWWSLSNGAGALGVTEPGWVLEPRSSRSKDLWPFKQQFGQGVLSHLIERSLFLFQNPDSSVLLLVPCCMSVVMTTVRSLLLVWLFYWCGNICDAWKKGGGLWVWTCTSTGTDVLFRTWGNFLMA